MITPLVPPPSPLPNERKSLVRSAHGPGGAFRCRPSARLGQDEHEAEADAPDTLSFDPRPYSPTVPSLRLCVELLLIIVNEFHLRSARAATENPNYREP